MRSFCPKFPHLLGLAVFSCALLLYCGSVAPAWAQTLARPGWAGSGLAPEPWWRSAIFYRIAVQDFQDSNGDGVGDLRGIALRMDYLQSLGVDAVVLEPPFDPAEFDDLLREASRRRVRLVVEIVPSQGQGQEQTVAEARQWFSRGAAGVSVRTSAVPSSTQAVALLKDLRRAADSFPGQRALLAEALPDYGMGHEDRARHNQNAALINLQVGIDAGLLRSVTANPQSPATVPLLLTDARVRSANAFFAKPEAQRNGLNKVLAAVLLTLRGAVSLRYGQELGLAADSGGAEPQTMQWTPTNFTRAAPTGTSEVETAAPIASRADTYGPFVPYVPPSKKVDKAAAPPPEPKPDPDSLPGFTSVTAAAALGKPQHPMTNVAVEDADPGSLLNFYRKLSQLHHGHAAVRKGTPIVLNHDGEGALVWVRRAPAGARTVGSVVVACNISDHPLALSIEHDLERLHIRSGTLRPLLASWTATPEAQGVSHIVLPPYSAFLGELYHRNR